MVAYCSHHNRLQSTNLAKRKKLLLSYLHSNFVSAQDFITTETLVDLLLKDNLVNLTILSTAYIKSV